MATRMLCALLLAFAAVGCAVAQAPPSAELLFAGPIDTPQVQAEESHAPPPDMSGPNPIDLNAEPDEHAPATPPPAAAAAVVEEAPKDDVLPPVIFEDNMDAPILGDNDNDENNDVENNDYSDVRVRVLPPVHFNPALHPSFLVRTLPLPHVAAPEAPRDVPSFLRPLLDLGDDNNDNDDDNNDDNDEDEGAIPPRGPLPGLLASLLGHASRPPVALPVPVHRPMFPFAAGNPTMLAMPHPRPIHAFPFHPLFHALHPAMVPHPAPMMMGLLGGPRHPALLPQQPPHLPLSLLAGLAQGLIHPPLPHEPAAPLDLEDGDVPALPIHLQHLVQERHESHPGKEPMILKIAEKDGFFVITGWFPGVTKADLELKLDGSKLLVTGKVSDQTDKVQDELAEFGGVDEVDETMELPYAPDAHLFKAHFEEATNMLTAVFPAQHEAAVELS